ncbi:hypothetical protein C8R43DRAFT_184059 [Mycena crocata]|nr:hypothetical protein C8R43DRAFT_184059 [Mycena crocata]
MRFPSTMSSYYAGQQVPAAQYPRSDEYSAPSTPHDYAYPRWNQQPDSQAQPQLGASRENPQALSLPPPPQPSQSFYPVQGQDTQHPAPAAAPTRGTHDSTPIQLLPVAGQLSARAPPVEIKPVMVQGDTTAVRSTPHPVPRMHAHQYHPYQRPSSTSGVPAEAQRRETTAQHIRFASQNNSPQAQPGSIMHSPGAGKTVFTSPMSEGTSAQATSPSLVSGSPLATPFVPLPAPPKQEAAVVDERRYLIRADTHYDAATRVLTALLELPGMKRRDLSITLATTPFNRLRHVTVSGSARAPFAPEGPVLRERKYGRFTRAFPVPADTTVDDIDAAMEDGLLILKIACGLPAASAEEHEIPIR